MSYFLLFQLLLHTTLYKAISELFKCQTENAKKNAYSLDYRLFIRYKVKITPGTGRRGKTSKTAFMMFLKERNCTNQEKDLVKAIKHDAAARNMPGKVKLSAPQMQRLRN